MELSKYVGSQIKKLRESHGMDQQSFADKIGSSRVNVARYESGTRKANQDILFNIAETFNVSINYFFPLPDNIIEVDQSKFRQVPLVGTIACGTPILAEQNIDGYIPMYFVNHPASDATFALRCKGTSMEPTLTDGDIVFIDPELTVEDGAIAAVLVDDDESATLKRIKHVDKHTIMLLPDNKNFDPIILNEKNPGKVLGKVIESRRKY